MKQIQNAVFLLLALIWATGTHAQQQIRGTVTSSSGQAISGADCTLLRLPDSLVLAAAQSDTAGRYRLSLPAPASALLRIRATGYAALFRRVDSSTSVADCILKSGKRLAEVLVTSGKPLVEQKPDKTIFHIAQSITTTGGDALEALKKTPGVLVMNNQVTIAGKGAVSILLNGRLQQVSGADLMQLLRSIPADNLSKIELITAPAAQYDAEGSNGLINLVMKKNLQQGFKGNAVASYGRNHLDAGSLSSALSYRKGNLNLFGNARLAREAYLYTNIGDTYYPGQVWHQEIKQPWQFDQGSAQLGADYVWRRRSTLGFSYTYNNGRTTADDRNTIVIRNGRQTTDSVLQTQGWSEEPYNRKHTLNLNYEWRIDTMGRKLNVDADYYAQTSRRAKSFAVRHFYDDDLPTGYSSNSRLNTSPRLRIKSIKADMAWPLKGTDLSFGIKASWVDNGIDNIFETEGSNGYVIDPSQTNSFTYSEQIQAAYINAQRNLGKRWELQLGLRAEHTHTYGYSPTLLQANTNDYTRLFPSGFLLFKPAAAHTLSLSYSRRISRPGYNMLNPFRYYYNPNAYTAGNPQLQPSFNDLCRLSWAYRSKYTLTAFANFVHNYWDRISVVDPAGKDAGFTRANIGDAFFRGLTASVSCSPARWWQLRGSLNGMYTTYRLRYYQSESLSGFNAWADAGSSFILNRKKTLSAEVNGYYYSPRQKDYKRWDQMSAVNIGIKALFLDQQLAVAVNADDIFQGSYWYQTNAYNGTTEYSYDDERAVRITVTYKFGNKNIKSKQEHDNALEELQRAN